MLGRIVELLEERPHNLACPRITGTLQNIVLSAYQFATPEEKDQRAGLIIRLCQRDHILIARTSRRDNLLLLQHLFHSAHAISQRSGALKLQVLGSFLHLPLQIIQHLIVLAFQEEQHLADYSIVFLARYLAHAGRSAAMDIILRARAWKILRLPARRRLLIARRRPGRGIIATGTIGKELVEQVQRRIDRSRTGIGTKIAVAILLKGAHPIDTRKNFCERDLDRKS